MRRSLLVLSGAFILSSAALAARPAAQQEIAYGAAPLQRLDFYPAAGSSRTPAPLIIFVHGGGWSRGDKGNATGAAKVAHFNARGWAVASLNYRLVPAARVEDSAADVAAAVARLMKDAPRLGLDPDRVILMGHSAGAHLAALVATYPRYLRAAGASVEKIAGVVLLDGAGYDVPAQMVGSGRMLGGMYATAFGSDPDRQRALSPAHHAAAPNAPRFLILHVDRPDARAQSNGLAVALRGAGTAAEVREIAGSGLRGHMEINRSLGQDDYPATAIVDGWIAGVVR